MSTACKLRRETYISTDIFQTNYDGTGAME